VITAYSISPYGIFLFIINDSLFRNYRQIIVKLLQLTCFKLFYIGFDSSTYMTILLVSRDSFIAIYMCLRQPRKRFANVKV